MHLQAAVESIIIHIFLFFPDADLVITQLSFQLISSCFLLLPKPAHPIAAQICRSRVGNTEQKKSLSYQFQALSYQPPAKSDFSVMVQTGTIIS